MISVDTPEDNAKFAAMHEADYPILSNPTREVAEAYGVLSGRGLANRWTFYIGEDGKILHIDNKVSASTAGPDIVTTLEKLGIPKR
jgi:thioredoxin-dependent peroxiredoxin